MLKLVKKKGKIFFGQNLKIAASLIQQGLQPFVKIAKTAPLLCVQLRLLQTVENSTPLNEVWAQHKAKCLPPQHQRVWAPARTTIDSTDGQTDRAFTSIASLIRFNSVRQEVSKVSTPTSHKPLPSFASLISGSMAQGLRKRLKLLELTSITRTTVDFLKIIPQIPVSLA